MTNQLKARLGLILGLVMLAVGLLFGGSQVATALDRTSTYDESECYEEVTIYGDIIEKETRTKTSNDHGQTWSEYGPWTDWPDAGPLNDDGRNRGPGFHGEDNQGRERWYRQYRYVVKGQYVKEVKQVEVSCPTTTTSTTTTTTTVPEETTTTTSTTIPVSTVAETTTTSTTVPVTTTTKPPCGICNTTLPPAPKPPTPTALPATGSENWMMAAIGGFLLLLGGGTLAVARRR